MTDLTEAEVDRIMKYPATRDEEKLATQLLAVMRERDVLVTELEAMKHPWPDSEFPIYKANNKTLDNFIALIRKRLGPNEPPAKEG